MRMFQEWSRWPRCSRPRSAGSNPASCVLWRTKPMTSPGEEYGECEDCGRRGGDLTRAVEDIIGWCSGDFPSVPRMPKSQFKAEQVAASHCRHPARRLRRLGGSVGLHKVLSAGVAKSKEPVGCGALRAADGRVAPLRSCSLLLASAGGVCYLLGPCLLLVALMRRMHGYIMNTPMQNYSSIFLICHLCLH
jgi:hypothetical protein